MAEGLLNALYGDKYEAYSAGTAPSHVNPYAIAGLVEIGVDISMNYSKDLNEFSGMEFDYVVAVCSQAKESCPSFPGGKEYLYYGFDDPSRVEGKADEKLEVFRRVRDEIKHWIVETFGEKPNTDKLKYDFIISLLAEGDTMICFDARKKGVFVPPEHRNNHSLNLVFNLNFKRPIDVQEEAIYATLAFGGRPYSCVIPMEAIWSAYDPHSGKGQVWGDSVPRKTIEKLGGIEAETTPSQSEKSEKRKGHLRVIK